MTVPTLQYSLNRLAGTLVNGVPTLDSQGAANKWAATPTPLDLDGALNYLYNQRFGAKNYSTDMPGVLNLLAGTYGLGEALAASLIAS